jgi:hypothetical protein
MFFWNRNRIISFLPDHLEILLGGGEKTSTLRAGLRDFRKSPSFLEFMEIENYLADILGIKVDLVMKSSLKPRIGQHILSEVEYL